MNLQRKTLCGDCRTFIVIGDLTSFDFHYTPEQADARIAEIETAASGLGSVYAVDGECEEYSLETCACCGDDAMGDRWPVDVEVAS